MQSAIELAAYVGWRLWSAQQHAEVQCIAVARLVDPFALLDRPILFAQSGKLPVAAAS
ncbi:MAG TPA: hypothetical protein VHI72_13585 [Hyphomicrobiaceae bacterium]|nr:hypothetical protein [Hyphomicrobiaceae bacterium]